MLITIVPTIKQMQHVNNMTLAELQGKSDAPTLILLGLILIASYLASLFEDGFDQ
jgi:hypothetical protein